MSDLNRIVIHDKTPRSVEIDPSCHSAYIRFSNNRVKKTLSDKRGGTIVSIDLDSGGHVIGIELVGVKEFSISAIRHHLPEQFRKVDFERARFTPAAEVARHRAMQPA